MRDTPTISIGGSGLLEESPYLWANDVLKRLSVQRYEGVNVNEMAQFLRQAFSNGSGDCPTITVSHEDHLVQRLILDDIENILNVGIKVNFRRGEMNPFADSGESRGVDIVTSSAQVGSHFLLLPTTTPSTVK